MIQGHHYKIIIDTNIWISFLIGFKSASFIRDVLTDAFVSIVMTDVLEKEIITVASRPKFQRYFDPKSSTRLLSFLRARSEYYTLGDIPQRCRDPKDDYLLELARVSNADMLVTGDKDLTEMKQLGKCEIITLQNLRECLSCQTTD